MGRGECEGEGEGEEVLLYYAAVTRQKQQTQKDMEMLFLLWAFWLGTAAKLTELFRSITIRVGLRLALGLRLSHATPGPTMIVYACTYMQGACAVL